MRVKRRVFYGWWIALAAFLTFGISTGVPYYNMPFFYDYYENAFGWPRHNITLGFPIAALLTLWVGPVLVPRFRPRYLILAGTAFTFVAFLGFSRMSGSLLVYYGLWFIYTVGYVLSGPIPHQIIISYWFRRKRGTAMAVAYVGVGLLGAACSWAVKPLAETYGFRSALLIVGLFMFAVWPIAVFVLRDRPSDMGLYADGDMHAPVENAVPSHSFAFLLRRKEFWLLLIGSLCSIGAIGAINQHMKLVFKDAGFASQTLLNSTWQMASILILLTSTAGRLLVGVLADKLPMKHVMCATYVVVAASIPMLLLVHPPHSPALFAVVFGFAMGADYMLIPLMAARQFGVNSLARAMAIILPVNTIGQTWVPEAVSLLRERFHSYEVALNAVLVLAVIGAVAIALMPPSQRLDEAQFKQTSAA